MLYPRRIWIYLPQKFLGEGLETFELETELYYYHNCDYIYLFETLEEAQKIWVLGLKLIAKYLIIC